MKILVFAFILLIAMGCQSTPSKVSPTTASAASESDASQAPSIPAKELGKKAWESEDYEAAAEHYTVWIEKNPEEAEVYFQRGRAYNKIEKFDEALKDFEQASKLNPKDLRPQVYRCGILFHKERNKDVKSCLSSIMNHPSFSELGPYEQFLAYFMQARFKTMHKSYHDVLPVLDKAIQVFDLNVDVFKAQKSPFIKRLAVYEKAMVYFHLGQHSQEFATTMKEYITLTQKAGETVTANDYKNLAMALFLSGQYKECKTILPNLTEKERKELGTAVDDVNFFTQD